MDGLDLWLWYLDLAALAGLIARIAITSLFKVYPFLFVYLLADLGGSLVLTQIRFRSNSYAITYMAVQVLLHILAVTVVLEMCRIALARHRGLASLARASVLLVIGCTILVAALGTLLDKDVLSGQSAFMHRFFTSERTLDLIIIIFLLLMSVLITWFPIELSRNSAVSIGGFSMYYLARGAGLLLLNLLAPSYLTIISDAMLVASMLVLTIWSLVLRPERVSRESVAGHSWDPVAMARLSRELDTINSALVRFGKR